MREVRRWFAQFEPDLLPVMRDELRSAVANTVVPSVVSRVPQRTGDAAASVRATGGGAVTYVVAGGASAPYFGWLDFGGHLRKQGERRNDQFRPVIKGGRYVYPGIKAARPYLFRAVEKAVDTTIRKAKPT